MSKKIPRNSKCLCGSGLKYKKCCGAGKPLTANSMSYVSPDHPNPTEFEKQIREYTGHYPFDYIKTIKAKSPIFHILIDESKLHEHYSVSGIVISKIELDKQKSVKLALNELVEDFYVDNIHFTEIFGRQKIFKDRTGEFILRYSELIKDIEMLPFSICMTKDEIQEIHKGKELTNEQIFISLQWQLMFKIFKFMIWKYGIQFIVHMWREQENITVDKRILHQENIRGLLEIFPFADISIYRHYEIFMKSEILSSSLSDLVAYSTSRLKSRIDDKMPRKTIIRDNYELIKLLSIVFKETKFIDIDGLDEMIKEVEKREKFRNNK